MPSSNARSGRTKHKSNRRVVVRNRKKRNLLKPFMALACLSLISYGVYWLFTAPTLNVTKAKVSGLELLGSDVLWRDVHPVHGKNILRIDTSILRTKIMKHPEVEDVNIKRHLPRTLIVHVTERKPVAVVQCANKYFLVDSSARPLRFVDNFDAKLPQIVLSTVKNPSLGHPIKGDIARSVLICLSESKKKNCQVDRISVDQHGNMCLNIGSSFFVKLGQPIDISRKLGKLWMLRSTLETRPEMAAKVLYFDVSCPERPAKRLKDEAAQADEAADL